jgi:hypothetical protein
MILLLISHVDLMTPTLLDFYCPVHTHLCPPELPLVAPGLSSLCKDLLCNTRTPGPQTWSLGGSRPSGDTEVLQNQKGLSCMG